jgi:hypothetical protein
MLGERAIGAMSRLAGDGFPAGGIVVVLEGLGVGIGHLGDFPSA